MIMAPQIFLSGAGTKPVRQAESGIWWPSAPADDRSSCPMITGSLNATVPCQIRRKPVLSGLINEYERAA
jgi:hypothetical protein